MNSHFRKQADHRHQAQIQSFYEPTLRLLIEVYERKKSNLRSKGYDEKNAAVTRIELSQKIASRLKITIWLAEQVITSLIRADRVISFGGYVKPKGEKP
ncbi:hypothetical protein CDG60_08565 [Acinetobacter chinensis]|jgi:hypothetical protein|uniref:Uncharacterized protein n=1 Tax=Acinetobacter chinensis TaxID=2004650 RepID=A0A3B7LX90_9GAMM|nr:hypothetical protein [Acinetobacter chinensis]AXY56615.1 hypothetical protein CDG60_08565 [Acinetobacter chinensis]